MKRQLPPFAAVRAFEAAARHCSFKMAAQELCLSPSAVSHQIRALEDYLDTALFERSGNRMALTMTGRTYAGKLTGLLDGLEDSTRTTMDCSKESFRVECTPGFAARWLVPRLHRLSFADRVRLQVSTGAPSTDFAVNDADFVIQWRDAQTPGVQVEPLMKSRRFPVICPDLKRRADLKAPADLLRMRLIYDETDDSWLDWFTAAGVVVDRLPAGPVFPNCELATTAVEKGQGISLAYAAMVEDTVKAGRLVRLFDTVTTPMLIYSMAYPESRAADPFVAEFRDWLRREAAMALPQVAIAS